MYMTTVSSSRSRSRAASAVKAAPVRAKATVPPLKTKSPSAKGQVSARPLPVKAAPVKTTSTKVPPVKPLVKSAASVKPPAKAILQPVSQRPAAALLKPPSAKPVRAPVVSVAPASPASSQGDVPEVLSEITQALRSTAPFTGGLVDQDMGPLSNDEVYDEADAAQHLQLREQADIQRRALLLNRPESHPDFDGVHCVKCDVEIPPGRLALNKVRCVDCQQDLENEQRRLGR
jgi:RNA polymerase-binding transcription factor DksA